ncbi:MAG: carboxymuconolactone decarboxylase family protein [Burkholderiales bacterium]
MGRVSKVDRESLSRDERRFFDAVAAIRRRPISGPFIVLMNSSPDLAARFAHLGHYFHARGQADESIVPIRVRSFISLIGSRLLQSPYEWAAWVNWALDAGVPQRTVDAIREGQRLDLDPTDRLVNEFCSQLVSHDHRVGGAVFDAARAHFGVQGLVELVVTLGYFAMIALPLNAFEIEMTPAQMALRRSFEPLEVQGTPWTEGTAGRDVLPTLSESRLGNRLGGLTRHEDLAPSQQHFLDRVIRSRGWISPVFAVLLHTPDVAERIAHIGEYILYNSPLPTQAKALVCLITARDFDARYTWAAATSMAADCGIDPTLVTQIEHGDTLPAASEEQRLLATFCRQLLRGNHHVADDVYALMVKRFGVSGAVQTSALTGYVAMMSIIATAFELAPPADRTRSAL